MMTAANTKFEDELVKAILARLATEKLITTAESKAILEEQKKLEEMS